MPRKRTGNGDTIRAVFWLGVIFGALLLFLAGILLTLVFAEF